MEILVILTDANGAPLTGKAASTALKFRRVADGFLLDWNDLTFKAAAWDTLATTLDEVDAVNLAGTYKKIVNITAWDDGFYQAFVHFDDGTTVLNFSGERYVQDGQEVEVNLDAAVSSRAATGGDGDTLETLSDQLDGVQADLDSPDQYKATGFSTPTNVSDTQAAITNAIAALNNATQGATKAELDAAQAAIEGAMPDISDLALEAGLEDHVLAVLNSYDPPTRAEATADQAAILAAITALKDITVGEILNGDLSDSLSFPANSLADRLRKLFWILCNRLAIVDATGAFTAYKGDGVTPGAIGTIVDNGTNTVRSAPTWP